jgi:pyrroloquinoline quinone (PQQ) biosynthesis protein C
MQAESLLRTEPFDPKDEVEMAKDFVAQLEKEFASEVDETINNPLVQLAQRGEWTLEHLQAIAQQEYNIVPQEFRHVALSILRTERTKPPEDLFVQRTLADILGVFLAEWEAYQTYVEVLGLTLEDVRNAEVYPGGHYFISWSHYSGSALDPEQHIAFLYMDWIAWGQACTKISLALQEQGKFSSEQLAYLALFTAPDPILLDKMRKVINDYAAKSDENKWKLRWAVKLGLDSEKMFWDSIYTFGQSGAPFEKKS